MSKQLTDAQREFLQSLRTGSFKNDSIYMAYDNLSNKYIYKNANKLLFWEKEQARKKLITIFPQHEEISGRGLDYLPNVHLGFDPFSDSTFFEDSAGESCMNSFVPTQYLLLGNPMEPREGLDSSFISNYPHFNALLRNLFVKQEYLDYFLNWFSFAINTREKTRTSILLKGAEGTGKDTLKELLIEAIYGDEYTYTADNDGLASRFNKELKDKMFVVFNEVKGDFKESSTIADKLKIYITERKINIEQKGVDRAKFDNYFNCMFFSNNTLPVQVSTTDRRYCIFNTASTTILSICNEWNITLQDFRNGLKNEQDAFIRDFFRYKWNRAFATSIIESEEKEALVEHTTNKADFIGIKIKQQDCDHLWSRGVELLETAFSLGDLTDAEYRKELQLLESFVLEVASGKITNPALAFAYKCFINRVDSATKVGLVWTSQLGKAVSGSERYRKIGVAKEWKKSIQVIVDDNDPFVCSNVPEKPENLVFIPENAGKRVDGIEYSLNFIDDLTKPFINIMLDVKKNTYIINMRNGSIQSKSYGSLSELEKEFAPMPFGCSEDSDADEIDFENIY